MRLKTINNMTEQKDNFLYRFLDEAVRHEANAIAEDAVKRAKEELERRLPEIVASVTVSVMQMTQMEVLKDRIVFTIQKKD